MKNCIKISHVSAAKLSIVVEYLTLVSGEIGKCTIMEQLWPIKYIYAASLYLVELALLPWQQSQWHHQLCNLWFKGYILHSVDNQSSLYTMYLCQVPDTLLLELSIIQEFNYVPSGNVIGVSVFPFCFHRSKSVLHIWNVDWLHKCHMPMVQYMVIRF